MNQRVSELLVQTGAFTDLEHPVILASGELGIYYINTEKLVMDNGRWKQFGNSSKNMIDHVCNMSYQNSNFKEVIDILAEKVEEIFGSRLGNNVAISGGQRRDWLFSGPVARNLNLDHISCYKDGKLEIITPGGKVVEPRNGEYWQAIHISDLLTKGSSFYSKNEDLEKGWYPMVSSLSTDMYDLVTVVSRLQGGEQNAQSVNVTPHALVCIDNKFLSEHSDNPKRALSYATNPREWSENYLTQNGSLALLSFFDPEAGKLDRAQKFVENYLQVLMPTGGLEVLDNAVKENYGKGLDDLFNVWEGL